MRAKPSYEELEKRIQELESIESKYKSSKEALQEKDSLFKMLYEKAPLGYQSLNENGHFIVVNQTWLDTLGYNKEEVIGKSFADFLHPDWRNHFKENFPRFKSIGEILGVEFEMIKKNGTSILVSFTGKISRDEKGHFQQTHCIFHDITEHKKNEQLLERYKNIVSSTTDAIAYLDENYRYIIVNNAYEDFSGANRDDFLGMTVAEYMGNNVFEEKIKSNLDRCLNGETVNYQEWFEYPTKGKRFVDVTYFPYRDGENHILGVIASTRDITERKQTENDLGRVRYSIENVTDSVFWIGDDGTFIDFNTTACERLGYSREELLRMHVSDLDPHFPQERWQTHWEEMKSHGIMMFETEHRAKNGQLIPMELVIHNQKYGDSRYNCVLARDITERKKAEEELIESESLFRGMFNDHSAVMLLIDPDTGQIIKANQSAVRYYGYTLEKILQMKIQQLNMSSLEQITEQMHSALKKQINIFEFRHLLADGQVRDVEVHSTPITIQHQKLLFSIIRDITERKRAEEALQESLTRYNELATNVPVGVYVFWIRANGHLEFEYVSDRWCEIHQVKREDVLSDATRVNNLVHPDDQDDFLVRNQESFLKRIPFAWEGRFIIGDGKLRWLRIESTPIVFENGDIRWFGVTSDITDRKRMEEDLRKDREHIGHILRATRTNINTLDSEYNLRQVDAVWQKIYGDPQGRKCYEYFMGLDKPCTGCGVPQALSTRKIIVTEEFLPKENRYIEVHTIPFQDENGEWLVTEFNIDITERNRAEAEREKLQSQLNQAQKLESVGRLAGGVAHDFNNMLGVILGHTEMALMQTEENHDLHADLKEIQKAAQRSADITKQLLAFARKQTISPRQLDLNDTVESMLNMLRRLIGEDIDLIWKPAAHIWSVKMDQSQIDQILANLCINARDAIDGVGKLTIETENKSFDEQYCNEHKGFIPGDFILLAVSDNGCGMEKEIQDNLFEPFFTTKEVGKGTGLGLATVYGIVKQNNGFIDVHSEPGQGTTFKIYLPRLLADEDSDKAVPEKKAAAGGMETILLVEDEPSILKMTRIMLERKGYAVLTSTTPGEAIEKARNHSGSIDLLMTDVVMPEMNGRDLSGKITDLYPDIRLLFMSGYTANVIAHQGVLDDGVAFMQKPFSMGDLTEKVREVLDTSPDKTQR
jgi:PAS domain S-box-containing protein